jgi:hypothetical protein
MKNYVEVQTRAVQQNAMEISGFCCTVVAPKISECAKAYIMKYLY